MAKQGYKFPELSCHSCEHHSIVGSSIFGTRYCAGAKKKKPKRFKSSDPTSKAPKWCPRRNSPIVWRVYTAAGEMEAFFIREDALRFREDTHQYIFPSAHRYRLAQEGITSLNAKAFYQAAAEESAEEALGIQLNYSDVIEIDDGLQPYYFYCLRYATLIVAQLFDRAKVKKEGTV